MKSRFAAALRAVKRLLADAGIECVLIGGQAAVYHGSERTTRDIDFTAWLADAEIGRFIERARAAGFETVQGDPLAAALTRRVLILLHASSGIQIDLMLAGSPFEDEVLRRAEEGVVGGVSLRVVRPDDLIVYKLLASRERDIFDVTCILEKGADGLEVDRVRSILAELDEALGRGDLVATLDRLLLKRR
jgi:predicted nucleotidyltransferase